MKASKEHEYKGRLIFRTDERRGAYNPWKINLIRQGFRTLAEAKRFIDQQESKGNNHAS